MDYPEDAELSRATIAAVYEGPAVADHSMDVDDLAPALLGIARACQRANKVLNGDGAVLTVQIRSEIKSACFHIDLDLVVKTVGMLAPLLPEALRTANDIADVMFGDGSVFDILKLLGDKPPEARNITNTSTGQIALTVHNEGDNSPITIVVPPEAFRAYADSTVRRESVKALNVLRRPGFDELAIGTQRRKSIVKKQDIRELGSIPQVVASEERVVESEREVILDVLSFNTSRDQKSKFSDGENDIWALIEDDNFWDTYQRKDYGLYDGDRFKVMLLDRQVVNKKIKTEHTIRQVLEIVRA